MAERMIGLEKCYLVKKKCYGLEANFFLNCIKNLLRT